MVVICCTLHVQVDWCNIALYLHEQVPLSAAVWPYIPLPLSRLQSDEMNVPKPEERAQWCGIPMMTQNTPASIDGSESSSSSSSQAKIAASVKSLIKSFDRPLDSEDTSLISLLWPQPRECNSWFTRIKTCRKHPDLICYLMLIIRPNMHTQKKGEVLTKYMSLSGLCDGGPVRAERRGMLIYYWEPGCKALYIAFI